MKTQMHTQESSLWNEGSHPMFSPRMEMLTEFKFIKSEKIVNPKCIYTIATSVNRKQLQNTDTYIALLLNKVIVLKSYLVSEFCHKRDTLCIDKSLDGISSESTIEDSLAIIKLWKIKTLLKVRHAHTTQPTTCTSNMEQVHVTKAIYKDL